MRMEAEASVGRLRGLATEEAPAQGCGCFRV